MSGVSVVTVVPDVRARAGLPAVKNWFAAADFLPGPAACGIIAGGHMDGPLVAASASCLPRTDCPVNFVCSSSPRRVRTLPLVGLVWLGGLVATGTAAA